ncbi:MAG TPA: hypothetical protein VNO23_03695 [Candidatus Binatia bacterium]|nr:hypothetical protein [Candidatus Binatia bacterium]
MSRPTCSPAITRSASSSLQSGRAVVGSSVVAHSATVTLAGSTPRAIPRTTRPRSVMLPRGTPCSTTGSIPMFSSHIRCAASASVAPGAMVTTSFTIAPRPG